MEYVGFSKMNSLLSSTIISYGLIFNLFINDNFSLSSFNNERGIVNRISNNNIWIYLKSIGYSVKLKLA